MRVAMIVDLAESQASPGGVETAVTSLTRELALDPETDLFCISPSTKTAVREVDEGIGCPVIRVPMKARGQILRDFRPWTSAVHSILDDLEPDIVHGQGLLHNGAAAAAWGATPSVVTAHGSPLRDADNYPGILPALVRPLLNRAVTRVEDHADMLINVTSDWRVNLVKQPGMQIHIPNAVDAGFYTEDAPSVRPIVHFFGGRRAIKGGDLLFSAWRTVSSAMPDAELRVYGYGDATGALPDRTVAFPALDRSAMLAVLRSGGIVVVPSRFEVSPMVVAEAWASMVPVVATAVGGVPAMAEGAAILCEPEPGPLAHALLAALEDDATVDSAVMAGRTRAERYRPAAVAAAHLDTYRSLLR